MSLSQVNNLLATLSRVSSILAQQNCSSYVVGGFVRDWLLKRRTADVDIAVGGNVLDIAQRVAGAVDGKYVLLDEVNKVARVVIFGDGKQWHLDFTSFRGGIEDDLARRDFSINAMAVELSQMGFGSLPKLIDPFFGEVDLRAGVVRAIGEHIFEEDAVRLLRAVRLAAELGFKIEEKTESLIRRHCQLIAAVPGERVREELLRLSTLPQASSFLRYLDELGLLLGIIPELAEMKGAEQPKEHFWDVFDHSVETVATVELLLRQSIWRYGGEEILATVPWSEEINRHFDEEVSFGSSRGTLLKLGGLLHDIAKPKMKTVDGRGRMHFYGHTKEGAVMVQPILERLRFSSREIRLVESLVYYHLRPAQMADKELPTHRAIYRYFRDAEGNGIDILFLALADYLATQGPRLDMGEWRQHCHLINYILEEHSRQQIQVLPVKLVDGHDLMNIFGLSTGPLIGKLLTIVREAQANGELNTREEALAFVGKELSRHKPEVVN